MASKDRPVDASSSFAAFLERSTLRRIAGARSFERGEDYFLNGQVKALAEHEGTITAKVQGTRPYRIELWIEEDDLEYSCTCPMGADGEFCKHCVAVGLSWTENIEQKNLKKGKQAPGVTIEDVRTYLLGQDKNALVEMLVNRSMEDDRLRQSLFIKAAKKAPRGSTSPPIGAPSMTPWNWTDSLTTEAPTIMRIGSKRPSIRWTNC
jgi:uncharacterized Zn finger protein